VSAAHSHGRARSSPINLETTKRSPSFFMADNRGHLRPMLATLGEPTLIRKLCFAKALHATVRVCKQAFK
jgi:hypothetical protein